MPIKPYAYAQLEGVAQEMRKDKNLCFYWEYGSPVATMPSGEIINIAKEFGTPRTSGGGWAIDETWIAGVAIGLAASGMPCICRFPAMAQIYPIEFIYNQAGKLRHMTGGQATMPLVIWVDGGGRTRGSAGQHTEAGYESLYTHLPGLKVVVPSNAYDAKGLMIAAVRDNDPVIFFEHKVMYDEVKDAVPERPYAIPFGEANVIEEGDDATIVAIGRMVHFALAAAHALRAYGISCDVIDPRTISPLDEDTILESVEKTGRLVVVDEAYPRCGMAADIASIVAEKAFRTLKAPIRKVTPPHTPIPFAPNLEDAYLPSPNKIAATVREIVS